LQWEDKLLGHEIIIITDHRMLEFFNTQWMMSLWQVHWYEYLSWFNYTINYVEGVCNIIANALLCMYSGWSDTIPINDWVNADVRLDPEGKLLPIDRLPELHAMWLHPCGTNGNVLKEHSELCIIESQTLWVWQLR
jgi:hypothetical protein